MLKPGASPIGYDAMRFALVLLLFAATGLVQAEQARWYKPAHAIAGKALFDSHCAACHQPAGRGAADWRERDANGLLPAPPLNGTAHSWHHPLAVLYRQIMNGSAPGVGNMPSFKGVLSQAEALAVIAYIQSLWSDQVYEAWRQIDESSRKGVLRP
jgi:mono/diheme cytochrome c family protein